MAIQECSDHSSLAIADSLIMIINAMGQPRLKSQHHAQRFLACHGVVNNLFRVGKHMLKAKNYRILRDRSFVERDRVNCVQNKI